ncbi:hypothetical protein C8R46DRAFT_1058996 [Mycena filopes]|nr:hypothetical protein C8R46DRAFT_1058996 [Mycena filopes]
MDETSPAMRVFEMGMGPHEALFSQMGAQELLAFRQTCRRIYALINESCFSLLRLLSPFFGNATEVGRFRLMQLQSGTLVSGSVALRFFNRLKWPGSDLDLYTHRPTAQLVVRFLLSNGYTYTPRVSESPAGILKFQHQDVLTQLAASVAERPPSYQGRGIADVQDFQKGDMKIQIIIATSTPMEVIINFHSTCVMNIISHEKAYALYPWSTFIAHQALIIETPGAGQEAARQKYANRGWSMIKLPRVHGVELSRMARCVGDRFTWTIALPPLLVPVPDLTVLNSWELEICLDPHVLRCQLIQSPRLKYKYVVAASSMAELEAAWSEVSKGRAPVDAELVLAMSRRRRVEYAMSDSEDEDLE